MRLSRARTPPTKGAGTLCVWLPHAPPERALDEVRNRLARHVHLVVGPERPNEDVHVLVQGRPTADQLAENPTLRALVIPYAGVPAETRHLLLDLRSDLPVYNLHHNASAAAELALALFLAAAKSLLPVDRTFRAHDWRSRYDGAQMLLLEGRTAVVLGYGAIGRRIARACAALGMSVSAVRRHPGSPDAEHVRVFGMERLPELLPTAAALFVALPLTPDTEGLIGAEELNSLPSDSIVVNVARGAIVDEDALFTALKEQRIAGAGLDVWYTYPSTVEDRARTPPSRHPFRDLSNVVMSPHRGGAFRVEELERRRMIDLAQTVNALARGDCPPHRVDVHAGY